MKEKHVVLIGAGGFARETLALIKRINLSERGEHIKVIGFVDDNKDLHGKEIEGIPVLGKIDWINQAESDFYIACTIGTGTVRKSIAEKVNKDKRNFLTLIDPSAIFLGECKIEPGVIICANCVISVNVKLGINTIINLGCTIGHDSLIEDFCTVNPGTNISGCVKIGSCCDIGTGTKVIQRVKITSETVLGAGTVVVRDINKQGTYAGVPARQLDKKEKA